MQGNNCGRAISGVELPLGGLAPAGGSLDRVDIQKVDNPLTHDQYKWSCSLQAPNGGLPNVVCNSDPPITRDSFFDVFFTLDINPAPTLPTTPFDAGTISEGMRDGTFTVTPVAGTQ